jgi:Zn finger protein HypA/HybF involved in hydrogenase expression
MSCEVCKKEFEAEELYCPHCLSANQMIFDDEEIIVTDLFE